MIDQANGSNCETNTMPIEQYTTIMNKYTATIQFFYCTFEVCVQCLLIDEMYVEILLLYFIVRNCIEQYSMVWECAWTENIYYIRIHTHTTTHVTLHADVDVDVYVDIDMCVCVSVWVNWMNVHSTIYTAKPRTLNMC